MERGLVWVPDVGSLSPHMIDRFSKNVVQRFPEAAEKFRVKTPSEENYNQEDLVLSPVKSVMPMKWSDGAPAEPGPRSAAAEPVQRFTPDRLPSRPPQPGLPDVRSAPVPKQPIVAPAPIQRKPGVRPRSHIEEITPTLPVPAEPSGPVAIARAPEPEPFELEDEPGPAAPRLVESPPFSEADTPALPPVAENRPSDPPVIQAKPEVQPAAEPNRPVIRRRATREYVESSLIHMVQPERERPDLPEMPEPGRRSGPAAQPVD